MKNKNREEWWKIIIPKNIISILYDVDTKIINFCYILNAPLIMWIDGIVIIIIDIK